MKRAITLFSGGGGADCALLAAGYELVAGLEIDAEIAAVANKNLGGHVRVGDILEANPKEFPACDLLHASPPCPSFSVAKANGEETPTDIAMAEKVAEFVRVLKPRHFTLENVRGYRQSKSFKIITDALRDCGYKYRVVICNAADFGVPQTRIRLFVLASLSHLPSKPQPTHQRRKDSQQEGLFARSLPSWIGWMEAIEDLIPSLPESKFADWQIKRLPQEFSESFVSDMQNVGRDLTTRGIAEPFPTVCATHFRRPISEPRAFIAAVQGEASDYREQQEPSPTIAANHGAAKYRAFILDDQNGSKTAEGRALSMRDDVEPMTTISSSPGHISGYKAFIIEQQNGSREQTSCAENEPVFTIPIHSAKHPAPRACLASGRVVKMTPRCLARFQSIPDWYELSGNNSLDCKIIGNAVAPLMYRRILESFSQE